MIGRVIQNYRVEALLGEGGMGTVYRAADTLLQRPVALKALHTHLMRDTTFFERFRNEAVVSARLNHPNVATLYNFIRDQDENFMVMEFVDGAALDQLLRQRGRFSVENAVGIIIQALQGLHHAHRREILHRDIKPANLMLTREGNVKLMDFGIARLVGSERLTRLNRVMGTLEYIAPEILDGGEPSVQSDLYAVGILLYELLSGKMPFSASTDSTLIHQILNQKPTPIRKQVADVPRGLEGILEKLLQKKPEKRYADANELRLALASIVPPAPLNWQEFHTKSAREPVFPAQTAATADKPLAGPSRLLGDAATKAASGSFAFGKAFLQKFKSPKFNGAALRKSIGWDNIRKNVGSMEGLILLGALLLALGIVTTGVWVSDAAPAQEKAESKKTSAALPPMDEEGTEPETYAASEPVPPQSDPVGYETQQPNYPVNDQPTLPRDPVAKERTPKQKNKPPAQERPETPSREEARDEPAPRAKDEPIAKKEEVSPKAEEEARPVVKPAPTRTVSVELRNESFSVAFDETLTSEQTSRSGSAVWLRTLAPVVVNGTTAIAAGARVRGRVTDVRSASSGSRAYLAVQFEAVEAVNGQWISIRFPEYSDKANDRVTFERNRRVNGVRVYRTDLILKQ